jgi:hypothetical protein
MENVIKEFSEKVSASVCGGIFVKLVLAKKVDKNQELDKVVVRYVKLQDKPFLQFVYKYIRRDVSKNFSLADGLVNLEAALGKDFLHAVLFTTTGGCELKYNKKMVPKIYNTKPIFTEASDGAHDKAKKRLVETGGSVYLKCLGITGENGEVIPGMSAKFKQVEKFVEIVASLAGSFKDIPVVKAADMGCGKGYLTFAVYDYLTNVLKMRIEMKGVETQDTLVRFCNGTARKSGFGGLKFYCSNINDFEAEKLDMLIALHACDTATDDAVYLGMKAGAKVIIVAPCCHRQIRGQMKIKEENVLYPALKYGILLERQAELITDTLRALILNKYGYKTRIFEFVEYDNTSKNLIITAEKGPDLSKEEQDRIQARIDALKSMFGIEYHYLEKLIENPLDQAWRIYNAQCGRRN